jgi:hypothetical protein
MCFAEELLSPKRPLKSNASLAEGEGEGEVVRDLKRIIAQESSDKVSNKGYISNSDENPPANH